MAEKNGLGFLGRVPIDTVLVGLLDAVSKGEIPGEGVLGDGDEEKVGNAVEEKQFPLLDKYLQTTSSKVWKGIAEGVVQGIETRRTEIVSRLQSTA
jgi:hypothetical protein